VQVSGGAGGESACTPDSVRVIAHPRRPSISAGGCPTAPAVYPGLVPSTGVVGVGGPPVPLSDLAPNGVCRAARVAPGAGALLPHRFTLTCARAEHVRTRTRHRRSVLCGTVLRVAPTGCYPAFCPVESGRSSDRSCRYAAARPTHHQCHCRTCGSWSADQWWPAPIDFRAPAMAPTIPSPIPKSANDASDQAA
jgi:hypothetical protein